MRDDVRELEMRITGSRPPEPAAIEAALRGIDPDARVRTDPETGITHVTTRRDTLEVVAALTDAGFEPSAETA